MAKKKLTPIKSSTNDRNELLDQAHDHVKSSKDYLATRRNEWDELEAMLIAKLRDDISTSASSKVFDPRLSTIVYERSARVMAQLPKGKAYATSKDDLGKTVLMNLLLDYYTKNANEQRRFVTKLRMLDLYSLVYGSMFALVPWRVNPSSNYVGPELTILGIRDALPQPNRSLPDADWFVSRNIVSWHWLREQAKNAPETWNIAGLESEVGGGDIEYQADQDARSEVDREYYPTVVSDIAFPQIETYTEYRKDKWVTWTPRRVSSKTSRPYILRIVENPYPNGMLPVVVKDAFPLLNSPVGIGEFARGKTLQYAINSLINLYLDGVKFSIFPPLHINPDGVVPSSIKWGAGEKWFMNHPNVDVQPMNLSPQGLDTFESTYSFLVNSLTNQSGTTDVMTQSTAAFTLGKTPAAVQARAMQQSARDEWDKFMMDETIQNIYERWIALTLEKQEMAVEMRLFSDEIKDIEKTYPDVTEMFESGRRGKVTISRKMLDDKYDFILEPGSTYRVDEQAEKDKVTQVLKAVIENPQIVEAVRAQGKDIDIAELFKRWLASNVKDWDKIIISQPQQGAQQGVPQEQLPQEQMQQEISQEMPQQPQQEVPMEMPQFSDPEIAQVAQEMMARMGGVPPVQ